MLCKNYLAIIFIMYVCGFSYEIYNLKTNDNFMWDFIGKFMIFYADYFFIFLNIIWYNLKSMTIVIQKNINIILQ